MASPDAGGFRKAHRRLKQHLGRLYLRYNRRPFVHPDPLEVLYEYPSPADREVVALVASSLAYGRVAQILRTVRTVLSRMGTSPAQYVRTSSRKSLQRDLSDIRHRFTPGKEIADLLWGVRCALERYGSLEQCLAAGYGPEHETIIPALSEFVRVLSHQAGGRGSFLLPSPDRGSACKRLNLFLRWLIRCDEVDPGGWHSVPASKLIVPLDTHLHSISLALGLTSRKQANLRTAVEVTEAFRRIAPDDPVRYDFALTRLGIRDDLDPAEFIARATADG